MPPIQSSLRDPEASLLDPRSKGHVHSEKLQNGNFQAAVAENFSSERKRR